MSNLIFFVTSFFLILFFNPAFAIILGSNNPFCSNSGEVLCNENFKPVCSDESFKPVCFQGSPNCCNENATPVVCNSSLITCEFSSEIKPGAAVDVEILTGPVLPEVFNSTDSIDKFKKLTGIAYSGSNPSYEINLKTQEENIKILSVDLEDNTGNIFKNTPFKIIDNKENTRIKILTLEVPSLAPGGATFTLNLEGGTGLSGLIEILDFLNISALKTQKEIFEPEIKKINIVKNKKGFTFKVQGKNFAPLDILITKEGEEEKVLHNASREFPNTTISLLPGDLKLKLIKSNVLENGRVLNLKFQQTGEIKKDTKAILVVATPRGIVSKSFNLKK